MTSLRSTERVRLLLLLAVALFGLSVFASEALAATQVVCRSGLIADGQGGHVFFCRKTEGCPQPDCTESGGPTGQDKIGSSGQWHCTCAYVFADGCGYEMTWVRNKGGYEVFWHGCQGPCDTGTCQLGESPVPGADECDCR